MTDYDRSKGLREWGLGRVKARLMPRAEPLRAKPELNIVMPCMTSRYYSMEWQANTVLDLQLSMVMVLAAAPSMSMASPCPGLSGRSGCGACELTLVWPNYCAVVTRSCAKSGSKN